MKTTNKNSNPFGIEESKFYNERGLEPVNTRRVKSIELIRLNRLAMMVELSSIYYKN